MNAVSLRLILTKSVDLYLDESDEAQVNKKRTFGSVDAWLIRLVNV